MASVRKRKWTYKGVEREAWIVEYTDASGKRRLTTEKSKKDADKRRWQIEAELESGTHTALNETVMIAKAADEFLRELDRQARLGDLTKGSVRNYESCLRRGIVPRFGARRVSSVTASEVQAYVEDLRERYMPRTIAGYYLALSMLLSFSVRRRWVKRNVLKDEPSKLPAKQKRSAIPSRADLKVLMATVSTRPAMLDLNTFVVRRAFVALGVFGGLRPGEIYGLQWENVDFVKGLVRVRHSLSPTDGLKAPKSAAGIRDVPMTAPIRQALEAVGRYATIRRIARDPMHANQDPSKITKRAHALWNDPATLADPVDAKGYVCLNRLNGPRYSESNNRFWDKLMKEANLLDPATGRSKFTPHALRHAAASLFIEAGLPAMNLKTVIGHSSVSTTYDVYGHLFPEDERTARAAHAIAAQFDPTTDGQKLLTT